MRRTVWLKVRTLHLLNLMRSLLFFQNIDVAVMRRTMMIKVLVTKLPNLNRFGSSVKFVPMCPGKVSYFRVTNRLGLEHSFALNHVGKRSFQ